MIKRLFRIGRISLASSVVGLGFLAAVVCGVLAASGCHGESAWSEPVKAQKPMLLSVWGTSPTDVWTVGGTHTPSTRSLVLHFDGTSWREVQVPATGILWWVYGFAPNDVWMCGEGGTILHYDGISFTRVPSGAGAMDVLYGIWGTSPSDMWSVGGQPDASSVIVHLSGGQWQPAPSAPAVTGGTWFKVWGSSASDVYVVGQRGSLGHWNGSAWDKPDLSATGVDARMPLLTVSGRSPSDVYAVGGIGNGVAIHFDGAKWSKVAGLALDFAPGLMGVAVQASGEAVLTGMSGAKYRYKNGVWIDDGAKDPLVDLHATWFAGTDEIFAAGGDFGTLTHGAIAHWGQPIASFE